MFTVSPGIQKSIRIHMQGLYTAIIQINCKKQFRKYSNNRQKTIFVPPHYHTTAIFTIHIKQITIKYS
jgi:hypothetical protein